MLTEQNRTEQNRTETEDNQGTGQRFCILVFVPQALFVTEQENSQNWGEKFLHGKIEREEWTEDRQTVSVVGRQVHSRSELRPEVWDEVSLCLNGLRELYDRSFPDTNNTYAIKTQLWCFFMTKESWRQQHHEPRPSSRTWVEPAWQSDVGTDRTFLMSNAI